MSQLGRALLEVRLPLSASGASRLAQALAGSQSGCSSPLVAMASRGLWSSSFSLTVSGTHGLCPLLLGWHLRVRLLRCSCRVPRVQRCVATVAGGPGVLWLFVMSLRWVVVRAFRCLTGSRCCSGHGRHPGRGTSTGLTAGCDVHLVTMGLVCRCCRRPGWGKNTGLNIWHFIETNAVNMLLGPRFFSVGYISVCLRDP